MLGIETVISKELRRFWGINIGLIVSMLVAVSCATTVAKDVHNADANKTVNTTDTNTKCKPAYTQVYQPPLKLGGSGRVIMVPSGEKCERVKSKNNSDVKTNHNGSDHRQENNLIHTDNEDIREETKMPKSTVDEKYIQNALKYYPMEVNKFLPERYDWLDEMTTRAFLEKSKYYGANFKGQDIPKRPVSQVLIMLNEFLSRHYLLDAKRKIVQNDKKFGWSDSSVPTPVDQEVALLLLFRDYLQHKYGNKYSGRMTAVQKYFTGLALGDYYGLEDPVLLSDLMAVEHFTYDLGEH